jgi:ParB-like chromosome segregation protein Spo0J
MNYLNELKTNPSNPRLIKKEQFERLKKSIGGFTKMLEVRPIAYDEDGVIWGGNMRYEALKALGIEMKPEYFKELTGYTLEEKREFAIRDNIELGEWDDDILANEWSDLPLDDWGIDTKGWEKEVEEDDVPEVSEEEPKSKLGEVYQLGRWVYCPKCGKRHNI